MRKIDSAIRKSHAARQLSKTYVVLLTNPRAGSTWLLDAIRCHPNIQFSPSAALFSYLDLRGRRYPRDLSNGSDASLKIEVLPNIWEYIPSFEIPEAAINVPNRYKRNAYSIEKIHPEFFEYNVSCFLDKVDKLNGKGIPIKFIYQVRDPKASISSFIAYQNRNPSWYPTHKGEVLVHYMLSTYQAIAEIAQKKPGLIVDYADIANSLENALLKIYDYLWPNSNKHEFGFLRQVSLASVVATSREKRLTATNSSFLGVKAGLVRGARGRINMKNFLYGIKMKLIIVIGIIKCLGI